MLRTTVNEIFQAASEALLSTREWRLFSRAGSLPPEFTLVPPRDGAALLMHADWSAYTLHLRNELSRRLVDAGVKQGLPFEFGDAWTKIADDVRPRVRESIAAGIETHRKEEPFGIEVASSVSWIVIHYIIEVGYGVNFGDKCSFRRLASVCSAGFVPCAEFEAHRSGRPPRPSRWVAF